MSEEQANVPTAAPSRRRRLYALAGVVLAVALAGLIWHAAEAPHYFSTTVALASVAFSDLDHAWVAGDTDRTDEGVVDATTDGGLAWGAQPFATRWDPDEIAFADARRGWAVCTPRQTGDSQSSDDDAVLATTDGGVTWAQQAVRTRCTLEDITCANATHAWAVGGVGDKGGVIIATADGGATWTRQYAAKAGDLSSVAFADARHGWAVGDAGIVATSDGGAHWQRQPYPGEPTVLTGVACAGASHAWVVGWGDDGGIVLATGDGGTTWGVQYVSDRLAGYNGVAFADALHGWVIGPGGTIIATTDGGRTWRAERSGTTAYLADIAFADSRHGLVVGNHFHSTDASGFDGSVVLRTTDGGATWKP